MQQKIYKKELKWSAKHIKFILWNKIKKHIQGERKKFFKKLSYSFLSKNLFSEKNVSFIYSILTLFSKTRII